MHGNAAVWTGTWLEQPSRHLSKTTLKHRTPWRNGPRRIRKAPPWNCSGRLGPSGLFCLENGHSRWFELPAAKVFDIQNAPGYYDSPFESAHFTALRP